MSQSNEKHSVSKWWFWVVAVAGLFVTMFFLLGAYSHPCEQPSFENVSQATTDITSENKIFSTASLTTPSRDKEEPTRVSISSSISDTTTVTRVSTSASTLNPTTVTRARPSSSTTKEKRTTQKVSVPHGNKIVLNNGGGKEQAYYDANVLAGLNEQMSEFEAVSKINNWLCETLIYEMGYVLPPEVLESGKAQCEGYSLLFYAMCRNASIECNIVSGKTKDSSGKFANGHTWNQVKIGDTWYYIDVCWNDVNAAPNRYFLTEKLWGDHKVSYVSEYGTVYF